VRSLKPTPRRGNARQDSRATALQDSHRIERDRAAAQGAIARADADVLLDNSNNTSRTTVGRDVRCAVKATARQARLERVPPTPERSAANEVQEGLTDALVLVESLAQGTRVGLAHRQKERNLSQASAHNKHANIHVII
jgi:hypothetical protein